MIHKGVKEIGLTERETSSPKIKSYMSALMLGGFFRSRSGACHLTGTICVTELAPYV